MCGRPRLPYHEGGRTIAGRDPPDRTLAILLVGSGCGGGGTGSTTRSSPAIATSHAHAAALAPLYRRLANRGFSVEAIRPDNLPSVALEASAKRRAKANLPRTARPRVGLSTNLGGSAVGVVYRFESEKLAQAAAPSFLRSWAGQVAGCGPTVFFVRPADGKAGGWRAEVGIFLRWARGCHGKTFEIVA